MDRNLAGVIQAFQEGVGKCLVGRILYKSITTENTVMWWATEEEMQG